MEYPKMLYRSETENRVVADASEEEKARSKGFGDYADLFAEPEAEVQQPEPQPEPAEPQAVAAPEPAPAEPAPTAKRKPRAS